MTTARVALRCTGAALLAGCLAAALGLAVAGCGNRPGILEQPLSITGPIVVGRHLAYLDTTREQVTLVRPVTREVRHVGLGRRPAFMIPTPDHSRLIVLCKGWVATARDEVDEAPNLHVIDPTTGELEVHELGSPFDEVAISDDNRFAVAFFSANAAPGATEVFRNPNAVAILDLETGELAEKNVRSFGDVPRGVVFSPSTMAPINPDGSLGVQRTLAVVFADGYVTLLDVTHPDRREVTVRLSVPELGSSISPAQMVFAPTAGTIYLTARGTNDVYVFTLTTRETTAPEQNDFVVAINTLAAGNFPSDVALFADGGEQKVLVANQASSDLTVIDALTAEFVTIPVGDPVDRILTYPPLYPEVAVVFSQGSPRQTIHFLELEGAEASLGGNLTTLVSAQPVVGMELIPNQPRALVIHDHTRSVISILDLTERTLSPFTGHDALSDYAITFGGGILGGFSLAAISTSGQPQLGIVDLGLLTSRTVVLDHEPASILTLQQGQGEPTDAELSAILVDHAEPYGLLTIVPSPLTDTAESTFALRGFLLEGVLDARY